MHIVFISVTLLKLKVGDVIIANLLQRKKKLRSVYMLADLSDQPHLTWRLKSARTYHTFSRFFFFFNTTFLAGFLVYILIS